jgi:hypothetical protein
MNDYPAAITTVNLDTILDGQRLDRPRTHFFPKSHDS